MRNALIAAALLTSCAVDDSGGADCERCDIWGTDDRMERYEATDPEAQRQATSSVALVPSSNLVASGESAFQTPTVSVGSAFNICPDQRFANQPFVARCSGTLVAPDLILTAGHCLTQTDPTPEIIQAACASTSYVFDFAYLSEPGPDELQKVPTFPRDNVFSCKSIEALAFPADQSMDYALVRLDRPVVGRDPMPVLGFRPTLGESVLQIGHPSGIPQKLAPGKTVALPTTAGVERFAPTHVFYDSDLFGGNSGGGVFHVETGGVIGVPAIYSGKNFVLDESRGCYVLGVCGENVDCPWGGAVYATNDMLTKISPDLKAELIVIPDGAGGQQQGK